MFFSFSCSNLQVKNPKESWGMTFNDILENSDDREYWQNIFNKLDHGENNIWEMKFNQVEEIRERDLDWDIEVNGIEGLAEDQE